MTTPSDPNRPDNGYGYQSGLPNFPAAPPPSDSGLPQQVIEPPREITWSFWCYVAAAVISLVGGLISLGSRQTFLNALRNNNHTLTDSQIQAAASVAVAVAVVFAVIFAGLYVLFAFKLRAGRNWARIVLTIIAALDLLGVVTGQAGSAIGYIGALAAIVGCVLSYLASSNGYINAVKAARYRG
jgi:hypothetical protein